MTKRDEEIAILIPCYNEELTVKKVITDTLNVLTPKYENFLIYVYDNNSTDNTKNEIMDCVSQNSHVIYKFESKKGKGNVICSMFRDTTADCYVLIDGDDACSVEEIDKFIDKILDNNVDMVIGDRLKQTYYKENKRLFHSFGNNLVSNLINKLFHSNISDIMSGYRAFSKKFVKTAGLLSKGFEIETEMTIIALDGRYSIEELPIIYRNRIQGSTSKLNTYVDGFKILKTIFTLFKDYKPFEFFLWISVLCLTIATIYFIPILITYMQTSLVPRIPTLICIVFLWILSILSFSLGVTLSTMVKFHKRIREIQILNYKG